MEKKKLNILIVDDHQMLLEGLRSFVANQFPNATILLASTHSEVINIIQKRTIDVLLLDLILGNEDSRMFLDQLLMMCPEMKIIVISSLEEELVVKGILQNGGHGFVGKSSSTMYISDAIHTVLRGEIYIDPLLKENFQKGSKGDESNTIVLTLREKEVLNETLKGLRIKEIAEALFISVKTVENHRSNLFTKFGVSNVTGLVKKALLMGFIPNDIK